MSWYVYILRCKDDTLYTGCTDNVSRRLEAHRQGKGAKYTRGRAPLELVYTEECADRSAALRRELLVKKLTKAQKSALISSGMPGNLCLPIQKDHGIIEQTEEKEVLL